MPTHSRPRHSLLSSYGLQRRSLLLGGAMLGLSADLSGRALASPLAASPADEDMVLIENFSSDGRSLGTQRVARIHRTEGQWRSQLSALSFSVTRQADTERPFSGAYDHLFAAGLYHCICCDTVQFDSRTKFDSRTGWPSFWKPGSLHNLVQSQDGSFGMQRTAISCTRCDAHMGHVFPDGPAPTGLRYCMNSVALRFAAHALS